MLTLNDGRSELWQWDTGRKLTVDADCSQVHFSNKVFGRSIDVDVVDGIADIPDTLLQTDKELTAWAFVGTAENGYTKVSKVFKVNKRNKPADYVFTEPDQTTLGEILGRIEDLENRPSGDVSKEDIQDAVNEYLDNNPVSVDEKDPTVPDWAKKQQKPTYTAEEVGALPDTTKIPSTAEDVGALPANAFIPKTAADVGAIPVPETATVGQTIVVKEVDESGKPVSWECADLAGVGSGGWELVYDSILNQDGDSSAKMIITKNAAGKEFAYRQILGAVHGTVMDKVQTLSYPRMKPWGYVNGVRKGFSYETYKSGSISGGSVLNAWQKYTVIGSAMIQQGDGKTNNFYGDGFPDKITEIELFAPFTDTDGNTTSAYCPLKAGGRITIYGRN